MPVVTEFDPTAHVRRILTPALNIPLSAEEKEGEDSEGSLTLFFHEVKDKDGKPSDKVLAATSCHVLRKDPSVDYEFKGGAPRYVRANGLLRFQKGLDEIKSLISSLVIDAEYCVRGIADLEAKKNLDTNDNKELAYHRDRLNKALRDITRLEKFYHKVKMEWGDIRDRHIGHVRFAKGIAVDAETHYKEDWGAFELDARKFKDHFEGTVVDLGAHTLNLFITSPNRTNAVQGLPFTYTR